MGEEPQALDMSITAPNHKKGLAHPNLQKGQTSPKGLSFVRKWYEQKLASEIFQQGSLLYTRVLNCLLNSVLFIKTYRDPSMNLTINS